MFSLRNYGLVVLIFVRPIHKMLRLSKNLLGLALLACFLATVAQAQTQALPTLSQSLTSLDTIKAENFVGKTPYQVKDAAELTSMINYIKKLYTGVVAKNSFQYNNLSVVDCVDVLTQPAARRFGVTQNTLKKAPTNLHEEDISAQNNPLPAPASGNADSTIKDPGIFLGGTAKDIYGNAKSCPSASIPMIRLTLEKMAEFSSVGEFKSKFRPELDAPSSASAAGYEYAKGAQWVSNMGALSYLNIQAPDIDHNAVYEHTLSQIWVVGETSTNLETVEVGWEVYGAHYHDFYEYNPKTKEYDYYSIPHLFIYSTQNGYNPDRDGAGCRNLECDDFVQTDSSVVLGGTFSNVSSSSGGTQYSTRMKWLKDGATGDWWLKIADTWVGYYPKSLYDPKGLKYQASYIDFGGEITNYEPDGRHTKTDMGSGHNPTFGYGFGYAAYQRNIKYVNLSGADTEPTLTENVNNADCYGFDAGASGSSWGTYFYFGGDGYHSTRCP